MPAAAVRAQYKAPIMLIIYDTAVIEADRNPIIVDAQELRVAETGNVERARERRVDRTDGGQLH